MTDEMTGWEVEASNIRFKFPKMTPAALVAMSVLFLLFQTPNLETELSLEPVDRPAAPSQPEVTVEVFPSTPAPPDHLESIDLPQDSLVLENEFEAITDSLSETESSVELVADSVPEPDVESTPTYDNTGFIAGTCKSLKAQGLGPFYEGDINYTSQRDKDRDGMACE